jgi:hypothetical protein
MTVTLPAAGLHTCTPAPSVMHLASVSTPPIDGSTNGSENCPTADGDVAAGAAGLSASPISGTPLSR